MTSWQGCLFSGFEQFWNNLRRFAFYNRTIFEMSFIFIYALEQVLLIWFAFNTQDLQELGFIVSLFAIIVLTTFALHKLLMESRIKFLEQEVQELQKEKFAAEHQAKLIQKEYQELLAAVEPSEDLKRINPFR